MRPTATAADHLPDELRDPLAGYGEPPPVSEVVAATSVQRLYDPASERTILRIGATNDEPLDPSTYQPPESAPSPPPQPVTDMRGALMVEKSDDLDRDGNPVTTVVRLG